MPNDASPGLSLQFLGTFTVTRDGTPVTGFRTDKARALLAYLAIERDRPHTRSMLAALLWPDMPEATALQNLRQTVFRLRHALDDERATPPFLLTTVHDLRVNPASDYHLDVATFEQTAKQGIQGRDRAQLEQAATLYGGELLRGFSLPDSELFGEWLLLQREQLQRLMLDVLSTLTTMLLEAGDYSAAQRYAQQQLALDNWRESAYRQLMEALAASGQRNAALIQYENCRRVLLAGLSVEPEKATVALYEQIRSGAFPDKGQGARDGEQGAEGKTTTDLQSEFRHPNSAIEAPGYSSGVSPLGQSLIALSPQQDWGEAPASASFYGREAELARLKRWVLEERCRLITVLAMGGAGKTTLVAHSARLLAGQFEFVFWRSLLNAPPLGEFMRNSLRFLSRQQLIQLPESLGEQITLLLSFLRDHRCLLVLDNVESVLEAGQVGQYRPGYEGYGQLIERIAQSEHQSCLVLTSRERPRVVEQIEDDLFVVRVMALEGLTVDAGQSLLQARGLGANAELTATVVQRYSGNPLALRLVARTIEELFDGDIEAFLSDESLIFDDIRSVLDQQLARLSLLEREILVWLAIEREATSLSTLTQNLVQAPARRALVEALQALQRRSLLEKTEAGFTLQNVVTEYLTDFLVEQVCQEFEDDKRVWGKGQGSRSEEQPATHFPLPTHPLAHSPLNRHTLLKVQAKEYVRQSQLRLILQPITNRLIAKLGKRALVESLKNILVLVQAEAHGCAADAPGYAGGNVLNLLLYLGVDLAGYDFSNICLWQAYLRGVYAPRLNLAGADFKGSVFTNILGWVNGLLFRADGELVVFGSSYGMACIWRAADGGLLYSLPLQDPTDNRFHLHHDCRMGVLGGANHALIVMDFVEARMLCTFSAHQSSVWQVVFSLDGKLIASGDTSGQVYVWEAESGHLLHCWRGHAAPVSAVTFSPAGDLIASADVDGVLCLWGLRTGELLHSWQAHPAEVAALHFALDGALLASGSHDHTVGLWDVRSPTRIVEHGAANQRLYRHTLPVRHMASDPSGRTLATCGADKFILLWDVQSGQTRPLLADHNVPIMYAAFSADGRLVAGRDLDDTIHVCDVRSGQRVDFYRAHQGWAKVVVFSPDGKTLIAGGADSALYVWDVSTPSAAHLSARLQGHRRRVESLAFSGDGVTVASGDLGGEIRLWNIQRGTSHTLPGNQDTIRALTFSPDGRRLASASVDGTLCLWEVQARLCLLTLRGHTSVVSSCAFSPDGRWLASGSMDRTICLWDARTGELLRTLYGHTNMVQQVCFCLDGRRLLSSSFDETMALWDATSGELLYSWPTQETIYLSLALHCDGKTVVAGGRDHITRLVEIDSGRVVGELHEHRHTVESVALSPDGRLLATAGHSGTIRLWDLAAAAPSGLPVASAASCIATLRPPGPYAEMNIAGVTGMSQAQKDVLKSLGAVES